MLGLAGVGGLLGAALAAYRWIFGERFLAAGGALLVIACTSAAVGLLAFGWDRNTDAG